MQEINLYLMTLKVSYVLATMPDENSETIRLMNTPAPKAPMSRVGRGNKTTAKVQRHSTQNKSLRGGGNILFSSH